MNRFIKSNLSWISLPGLAVAIVVLVFIFRPKSPHYQIDGNETIRLMKDRSIEVELQGIAGKQLIDIRSAELFSQGHPPRAINIPIRQLLDKASLRQFDNLLEEGKEAILYGADELQATAPLFLLHQLGYKNLKLLKGGINKSNEFIPLSPASEEVSLIDTAALHGKGKPMNAPITPVAKKRGETVIPVRKRESAGGGC